MFLVTLRQHRAQILVTAGFLVAMATALLVHGLSSASDIETQRTVMCSAQTPYCDELKRFAHERYIEVGPLLPYLGLLPALIGAFWGAPVLAREYETGTIHLAWTQTVSRWTWLTVKIATLGGLVALGGVALGMISNIWLSMFQGFDLPGVPPSRTFSAIRNIMPVGWWLFGFAVGVAAGVLIRRMVPAMAITVVSVVATVMLVNILGLQRLEQVRVTSGPLSAAVPAGALLRGHSWFDSAGQEVSEQQLADHLPRLGCDSAVQSDSESCLFSHGYYMELQYEAPSPIWRYQIGQTIVLIALSLLLAAVAIWRAARQPA